MSAEDELTDFILDLLHKAGGLSNLMDEEEAAPIYRRVDELQDAVRAEAAAAVLRGAIARLSGVAESASERKQPGLNAAVGVLLDMVTGRDAAGRAE